MKTVDDVVNDFYEKNKVMVDYITERKIRSLVQYKRVFEYDSDLKFPLLSIDQLCLNNCLLADALIDSEKAFDATLYGDYIRFASIKDKQKIIIYEKYIKVKNG